MRNNFWRFFNAAWSFSPVGPFSYLFFFLVIKQMYLWDTCPGFKIRKRINHKMESPVATNPRTPSDIWCQPKVSHETCSTLSGLLKSSTDTLINKQTCLMFHFPFAGAPYFSFPASQPASHFRPRICQDLSYGGMVRKLVSPLTNSRDLELGENATVRNWQPAASGQNGDKSIEKY